MNMQTATAPTAKEVKKGTSTKEPMLPSKTASVEDRVNFLKQSAGKAGKAAFHRIGQARLLYNTDEWVNGVGGQENARDMIESDFLHDLTIADVRCEVLFAIFEQFPTEDEWVARDYSLQRLYAEWKVKQKQESQARKSSPRRAKLRDIEELQEALAAAEEQLKAKDIVIQQHEATIKTLTDEIAELKQSKARLEGQIDAYKSSRAA